MNSEELEQSLKAEFENHINSLHEGIGQQIAEFQSRIMSDLERQRAEIEDAFRGFAVRFDGKSALDGGFSALVAEHLKLARDEGAKLAATAYAEAEKIEVPSETNTKSFADLRDAINEIGSKTSQAAILASLVERAAEFAPRGAFFILKNEHLTGWKAFGDAGAEQAVHEIYFPLSMNSILGHAAESRSTVEAGFGEHSEDTKFLEALHFGQPDRMYAIPLLARGRGVAVLYVDHGLGAGPFNLEALETLVRIAGMTVELVAASAAQPAVQEQAPAQEQPAQFEAPAPVQQPSPETNGFAHSEEISDEQAVDTQYAETDQSFDHVEHEADHQPEQPSWDSEQTHEENAAPEYAESAVTEAEVTEAETAYTPAETSETPEYASEAEHVQEAEATPEYAAEEEVQSSYEAQPSYEPEPVSHDMALQDNPAFAASEPEPAPAIESPFERTVSPFEPPAPIGSAGVATLDQAVEVAAPPVTRARLSDRQVDLPIEVPEDERRLHTDARRFARLLVSEIKLYNEKRVLEGRQANDLYDRLKEAIDRSREMYDKRVQPQVASRFDYFHYELLNSLAEGDANKFGNGYPGAAV